MHVRPTHFAFAGRLFRGLLPLALALLWNPAAAIGQESAPPTGPTTTAPAAESPSPSPATEPPNAQASATQAELKVPKIDLSMAARRGVSWDLQPEGGVIAVGGPSLRYRGLGRLRAGVLVVREPLYQAYGLQLEGWGQSRLALGVQAELTHLWSGFWGQLGVALASGWHPQFEASVGWSVIGVEGQMLVLPRGAYRWAFITKLRVPIGILVFGLTH